MEIVYYRIRNGWCPAKEFLLKRYGRKQNDDPGTITDKAKRLAKVDAIMKMAAGNGGVAGGKFSGPVEGFNFQAFKIPEGNKEEQVRILYFSHRRDKLILLNAYDKPDLYEKNEKGKIEKRIEFIHKQTQEYYNDFLRNPNRYEKYEN